jgi:diacylglycerol kinase (ATP)
MRNKFLGTGEAGYHPLRKIRTVASGLRYAVLYDFSVGYKLVLSGLVLIAAAVLRPWVDLLMIVFATGLVLAAELFNSAIEALCDFIETRHDEKIRVIKDIAAAAVGVCIVLWAIVLLFEVWEIVRAFG